MLRSSVALAARASAAHSSRRLLSSAAPKTAAVAKQQLPKNASIGLAAAGCAVFLFAGASANSSHAEDATVVVEKDDAAQIQEVIALITKRLDALESLVAEDKAAKDIAKQVEAEQSIKAQAEAALAELKQEVENLSEAAPTAVAEAVETVKEAAGEASTVAGEAVESAKEVVAEVAEIAKEVVEEAAAAAAVAAGAVAVATEAVAEVVAAVSEAVAPAAEAEAEKKAAIEAAAATNRAFIFIKPHANTEQVDLLVRAKLAEQGMVIKAEGVLQAEEIDSRKLIDTHYGAIAGKAVLQKPAELNVPAKGKAQFQEAFGMSWEEALEKGQVLNAADACAKLGVNGDELEGLWRKIDKKSLIKFGGGFYCGQVEPGLYVINGFYMQMRGKYTTPPASIRFYEVEWNPASLSWKAFRERFLGATDPTKAAEGSLRRKIYENWEALGLKAVPDTGDNGMHGSASPFEALAEVSNWEGKDIETDAFGKGLLLASGLDKETLKVWLADAQVPVDGKPTSIFDTLEDQDSKENLDKVAEIVKNLPAKIVQ